MNVWYHSQCIQRWVEELAIFIHASYQWVNTAMSKMLNVEQGCETCWATICMSSLNQNELPGCIDLLPPLLNVGVSSWCWQKTILWKCFGSMLEDIIIDVFSITCMTCLFVFWMSYFCLSPSCQRALVRAGRREAGRFWSGRAAYRYSD